jgi:hypothetical protein
MMDFAELTNTQASQWLKVKNFSLDELEELRLYSGSALLGLLETRPEFWPDCLKLREEARHRLFSELNYVQYAAEGTIICYSLVLLLS